MTNWPNFHAHSTFCDGSLTPESMVEAAIERGCGAFGISGHSYTAFDTRWCMSQKGTEDFIAEMNRLKKKYTGRIRLFTGVEQDYFSTEPTDAFDYVIGACHYVKKDETYILVDESEGDQAESVRHFYGGDYYAFTRDYFANMARIATKTQPDFIGHFDLVTKFNEGGRLFDEADRRYVDAALEALAAAMEHVKLFELNTGAMYRVGKTAPYPALFLLKEIQNRGGEIILSSDSHDAESICYKFTDMAELLKSLGFKYAKTFTGEGFSNLEL